MIFPVEWGLACYADVQRMHWRTASRICAAVYAFARTGRGQVEQHPRGYRLRVSGAVALFQLEADVLTVKRVFSAAR